jgi:hypothetical protein
MLMLVHKFTSKLTSNTLISTFYFLNVVCSWRLENNIYLNKLNHSMLAITQQFGVSLNRLIARTGELPSVVVKCIEYIESKGLEDEGIFRVPGSNQAMEAFKEDFNLGREVDFFKKGDPYTVGGN